MQKRITAILSELKAHAPFTLFGALTGIGCMLLFKGAGENVNHSLFMVFHPAHVLLSAVVTASLFKLRQKTQSFITILIVGYFGSIGVATLSDCVVPFLGETILGVAVPAHGHAHESEEHVIVMMTQDQDHKHEPETTVHNPDDKHLHEDEDPDIHLGFIEEWYLVNPAALIGILLAFWLPHYKLHTKLPHASHVLISTWASSFHVLMNTQADFSLVMLAGLFIVLFIAVWLPCCISDIIFPMIFVEPDKIPTCCPMHTPKEAVKHE